MSKTTTSTISHNLPDFPYCPALAARGPLSGLLSSSHFVTTLVSPPHRSSSPSAVEVPSFSSPPDPADPHQEYADFLSAQASPLPSSSSQSFQPSPDPAEHLSVPLKRSHLQSLKQPPPRAESSKRPSTFLSAVRLRSSKPSTCKFKGSSPALIEAGDRGSLTTPHLSRSSWRRFKKMGNRIVTPFRSLGICITSGRSAAIAYGEDCSTDGSSLGSSLCSSGEYPPEFIRTILENNVLLAHLTVDR